MTEPKLPDEEWDRVWQRWQDDGEAYLYEHRRAHEVLWGDDPSDEPIRRLLRESPEYLLHLPTHELERLARMKDAVGR